MFMVMVKPAKLLPGSGGRPCPRRVEGGALAGSKAEPWEGPADQSRMADSRGRLGVP